jgi:hypothetical protein
MNADEFARRTALAIETDWKGASESPSQNDWDYRWDHMQDRIYGLKLAAIYYLDLGANTYKEASEDLDLLQCIARQHWLDRQSHLPERIDR